MSQQHLSASDFEQLQLKRDILIYINRIPLELFTKITKFLQTSNHHNRRMDTELAFSYV